MTVDFILGFTSFTDQQFANANIYEDEYVNVTDITVIVNYILNGSLSRETNATTADYVILTKSLNALSFEADGSVSFEFHLSHDDVCEIILTPDALVSGINTKGNTSHILIIEPTSKELFTTTCDFTITNTIVASNGNEISPMFNDMELKGFTLNSIYPNPFNPVTTISYSVPVTSQISVAIYDISGNHVADLVNGTQQYGDYNVEWNASDMASGIYIVRMVTPVNVESQKIILLK